MGLFDQQSRTIYSVTRLNREVRGLLESNFGLLWIEAEISNFSTPSSGHWYFSLKDDRAQVKCAMFKNRNMLVRFRPKSGEKVLVRARISVYEPRGDYQLIIEHMEAAGQGDLQRQFDELKARLDAEGLFKSENKKDLPSYPQRIGVITSPSGAAIKDVLSVLERRYPSADVLIYPVSVQGDASMREIIQALSTAAERKDCDVLILTRGGGSIEDLWSFNDESVARTIAHCPIPIVAGVGHETDFTIADFVADRRAPTPSVAAEMVTPDQQELESHLSRLKQRHQQQFQHFFKHKSLQYKQLHARLTLQDPKRQLQQQHQQLDELTQRLQRAMQQHVKQKKWELQSVKQRINAQHPRTVLKQRKVSLHQFETSLSQSMQQVLSNNTNRLTLASRSLDTLSPLKTLDRGYAIALSNDHAITSVTQVTSGDNVVVRLKDGTLNTLVK